MSQPNKYSSLDEIIEAFSESKKVVNQQNETEELREICMNNAWMKLSSNYREELFKAGLSPEQKANGYGQRLKRMLTIMDRLIKELGIQREEILRLMHSSNEPNHVQRASDLMQPLLRALINDFGFEKELITS